MRFLKAILLLFMSSQFTIAQKNTKHSFSKVWVADNEDGT